MREVDSRAAAFRPSTDRIGSGGRWGVICSTAGVYATCIKLREAGAQQLGVDAAEATFADGHVTGGGRRLPWTQAAAQGEIWSRT